MLDIIHILTGTEPAPPSLDSLVTFYVEKAKFDFERLIWWTATYLPSRDVEALVEAYEALPEAVRIHLLLSPAMYELLTTFAMTDGGLEAREAIVEKIEGLVYDELSIHRLDAAGVRAGADEIWSATGDVCIRKRDGNWERQEAERLDSIVVLDFDSPYARIVRPLSSTMRLPAEDFTPEERAAVISKCNQAFAYVDAVSPVFARLIRNYTRAVRFRKAEKMNAVSSEHVTTTIGEIRLLNLQNEAVDVAKVVEQLIHESVHNLLSTFEYTQETFLKSDDDKSRRPTSLWSGNALPVASFTHAIFVWFALYNFAVLESRRPGLSVEERRKINERRNRYAAGFVGPTRVSDHIRTGITFSRILVPAIDIVQDTVLQSLRQSEPRAVVA